MFFFLSQLLALFSHLYPGIFVLCKTKIWLTVVNLRTLKSVWETIPEEEMVTKKLPLTSHDCQYLGSLSE